jgi:hypothetical protein
MISVFREKLFSTLERHSRPGLEPFGLGTRVSVLVLMIAFVALGAIGYSALVNPSQFADPAGLNLEGKWEFYNASLKNKPYTVEVPKPLAPQLKEELAPEYYYKKRFPLPSELLGGEDLSITLGTIKGKYTIWINGEHLATSVAPSELANYALPKSFLQKNEMEVLVHIEKADTQFPGIVHFIPMQIGRTKFISQQVKHRFFQLAVKPIVPTLFKGMIFLIFATLFFSMAIRREYFWFSIYALTSALSAFSYWQYSPFFENFFLRQKLIFFFYVASVACLPLLTVEFCRLGARARFLATVVASFVAVMPLVSLFWIETRNGELYLYEKVYTWAPSIVFPICILLSFGSAWRLGSQLKLRHRMLQLSIFGIFLSVGYLLQTDWGRQNMQFRHLSFSEMIDVSVFVGLALSMVFDFKMTSLQWQRSQKSLPSMVARLASVGLAKAVVEFDAIVLVIDVVGYTKRLISLSGSERDAFNSEIKQTSQAIIQECGGEKISDTGDGAVFVWTYKNAEERNSVETLALQAAERLNKNSEISFRCGISAGQVKCHWDEPQFSFLGDPINIAARLQSVAEPGGILVDEGISISGEITAYEIKGARFRARALASKKKQAA